MSNAVHKLKELLIIDDDQDQLNLIQKLLSPLGHVIHVATNVEEGLEIMNKRVPHVILLDMMLNHESGLSFLKIKCTNPFFKNIPLMIMSSTDNQKIINTALAMGANDFLKKPISNISLISKIKNILKEFTFQKLSMTGSGPCSIEIEGEIDQINEVGCMLNSPVKFFPNKQVEIDSKLFLELEMENCRFKILEDYGRTPTGHYKNEISFVGIQEKSSKKIRSLRNDS